MTERRSNISLQVFILWPSSVLLPCCATAPAIGVGEKGALNQVCVHSPDCCGTAEVCSCPRLQWKARKGSHKIRKRTSCPGEMPGCCSVVNEGLFSGSAVPTAQVLCLSFHFKTHSASISGAFVSHMTYLCECALQNVLVSGFFLVVANRCRAADCSFILVNS